MARGISWIGDSGGSWQYREVMEVSLGVTRERRQSWCPWEHLYGIWDMMELCGAQEDGVCCGTWERCSSLLQAGPGHG